MLSTYTKGLLEHLKQKTSYINKTYCIGGKQNQIYIKLQSTQAIYSTWTQSNTNSQNTLFFQTAWLQTYIDFNTQKEKNLFVGISYVFFQACEQFDIWKISTECENVSTLCIDSSTVAL
jgi:hypothetical protein